MEGFPLMSLVATLLLPVIINLLVRAVGIVFFRKKFPDAMSLVRELAIMAIITAGITLAAGGIMKATGLFEMFFFRPSQKDYGEFGKISHPVTGITIPNGELKLDAVMVMPTNQPPEAVVLHLHGSDRNITHTLRNVAWMADHGIALVALDYTGYGKTPGKPSMPALVSDSMAGIRFTQTKKEFAGLPVTVFGQSMGGQLAIIASALEPTPGLKVISDATYADPARHLADKMAAMGPLWLFQWVGYLMAPESMKAIDHIPKIDGSNLMLIHGLADKVVHPRHGQALAKAAQPGSIGIFPENAGHLRAMDDDAIRKRIIDFVKGKPETP